MIANTFISFIVENVRMKMTEVLSCSRFYYVIPISYLNQLAWTNSAWHLLCLQFKTITSTRS